jgi:hypothetical protein
MAEEQQQTPPVTAEQVAALQSKVTELEGKAAQVDDLKRTAEFWHGQATSKGAPARKTADEQADEEEQDLLEIVASKGAKGLDALLEKRGFAKQKDIDAKVDAKVSQVEREGQLLKDYPDLGDKNSAFFKDTAAAFGALKSSGVPEDQAMSLAAERTALAHIRAGKMKTPQQVTEETKAARETARLARIAAQASDGSGRGGAEDEEGDTELTDAQRRVAVSMLVGLPGADGKPMSEEQAITKYKERASKGVAMASKR